METHPKVVKNKHVKIPWDFQIQTDIPVMGNYPDIVVVDKHQRTAVVEDVAMQIFTYIRKKEQEKLQKHQGLREHLQNMLDMKATVVPTVIRALGDVTSKMDGWLQQKEGTSEISMQKSANS